MTRNVRVAVVASAQIFGGFQNLPPLQSLDFSAFFGLSHLFPPRPSISVIFDTDLVTLQGAFAKAITGFSDLVDGFEASDVLAIKDYIQYKPTLVSADEDEEGDEIEETI